MDQPENQATSEQPPDEPVSPLEESTLPSSADQPELLPVDTTPETAPQVEEPAESRPQSRVGRFLRSALRWALMVVMLFALGVFTAYFVLYRPVLEQNSRAEADLAQVRQQLSSAQANYTSAQNQVKTLQAQTGQAQTESARALNQSFLQMTLTDVANARLALANKDGTAAREALLAAQNHLSKLLPAVQEKDRPVADAISARLTLALNELSRDPKTAMADLDVLTHNLQDLDKVLFPS